MHIRDDLFNRRTTRYSVSYFDKDRQKKKKAVLRETILFLICRRERVVRSRERNQNKTKQNKKDEKKFGEKKKRENSTARNERNIRFRESGPSSYKGPWWSHQIVILRCRVAS